MSDKTVDFGKSVLDFIAQNIGPDKNLLIVQDKFFEQEYNINIVDLTELLDQEGVSHQKIKNTEGRIYLAIASTDEKIDQYLNSEVENEYQATILEYL